MAGGRIRIAAAVAAAAVAVSTSAIALGSGSAGAAPALTVDIGDATVLEGDLKNRTALVPVTLTAPAATTVSVDYQIVAGTATPGSPRIAGSDFNDRKGAVRTLTFKVGNNGKTPVKKQVAVPVYPDTTVEGDETVLVVLSNPPAGYALGRDTGTVTIVDDDPGPGAPVASVGDATITEGDDGKYAVQFTIALSQPALVDGTVDITVHSGTATCGPVYYGKPLNPGTDCALPNKPKTVLFRAGATGTPGFRVYTVRLFPDLDVEGDETFTVELSNPTGGITAIGDAVGSATILDDDD
jgi:chitinase